MICRGCGEAVADEDELDVDVDPVEVSVSELPAPTCDVLLSPGISVVDMFDLVVSMSLGSYFSRS